MPVWWGLHTIRFLYRKCHNELDNILLSVSFLTSFSINYSVPPGTPFLFLCCVAFRELSMPFARNHPGVVPCFVEHDAPAFGTERLALISFQAPVILDGKQVMDNRPVVGCGGVLHTSAFSADEQTHGMSSQVIIIGSPLFSQRRVDDEYTL